MNKTRMTELMVTPEDSLLEVLRVIDLGAEQIAIVVSQERKLLGLVTDGDVRRALLSGANLETLLEGYYTKDFKSVTPEYGREAALDLMAANRIEHLPIIDRGGNLSGLHLLSDLVVTEDKPNWAVVMVGGKGTRLGKLTSSLPKPMIKVAGRPILERIILQLMGDGIRRIFLAVNYLSHVIEEHFGDGSELGCQIEYLREDEPMGSGGALSLLPEKPSAPILVMNGDLITEFSLDGLLKTHASQNAAITMGVRKYTHSVPFGCVNTEDDLVTGLREKPLLEEIINTGIYTISPDVLQRIPREFFPITDLIEEALHKKENVACYHIDEWIDVGMPHQLAEARGELNTQINS